MKEDAANESRGEAVNVERSRDDVEEVFDAIKAGKLLDVREIGHALVDHLPERSPLKELSDLAYRAYVVRELTLGLLDLEVGRTVTQEEVERLYPLED